MRLFGKKPAVSLAAGAVFSLLAAFGWQMEHLGKSMPLQALLAALLLWLPVSALLGLLFRLRLPAGEGKPFRTGRAFLLLLLCWTPSLLVHFPGSFAYDVPYQLEQFASGVWSTHHPLLHTLLLGLCVNLGRLLGKINLGAALYSCVQMVLLAGCFSLACGSLSRQSSARAAKLACGCFALYPLHMLMAVNATKDTLFSGCFVLALALLREWMTLGRLTVRRGLLLALSAVLSVLLRNNMVWALGAFVIVLLIARRVRPAALLSLCLVLGVGCGQLLAGALHATPGDMREMLSWPVQQLARVSCMERDVLTDEEKKLIDDLMPEMVWKKYDPTVSDPVKFGFHTEKLKEDPVKYAGLCLSVLVKAPGCSLDAILALTHAFLYPYAHYGVSGRYLQTDIKEVTYTGWGEDCITDESPVPALREAISWRFGADGAMKYPFIGWLFNMGLIIWLVLFAFFRSLSCGQKGEGLAAFLPVLLMGTFLLGPVMAGRYVYPFVCVLPVLLAHVSFENKK